MQRQVRDLFPAHVVGVELHDPTLADPLFDEELAWIARAVDKRKHEFALGRTCARRALASLGVQAGALVPNADRSVPWPDPVWGSITHAEGYCAAIAARRSDVRGLGIDAELKDRVHERLWKQIATERELRWLESARDEGEALLFASLLFSAKEAFYKAQFCVSRAWVGFHDAEVSFAAPGAFVLELVDDVGEVFARGTRLEGKYCVLERHVVTGVVIE